MTKQPDLPALSYSAKVVLTTEELDDVVRAYAEFDYIVFDVETVGTTEVRPGRKNAYIPALDERTNKVFWIALAGPGRLDVIPIGHPGGPKQLERHQVMSALKPLFFDTSKMKINQNVKFDVLSLAKYWGEIPPGPFSDTITLVHLLNENLQSYSLGTLGERYLDYTYAKLAKDGVPMDTFPFEHVARYVGIDAKITQMIWEQQRPRLQGRGNLEAVLGLENDVTEVLIWAKYRGVLVDTVRLAQLGETLAAEREGLERLIYLTAGKKFLITSTQQKAKLLYGPVEEGNLGLPCSVKTDKGAQSTSEKALAPLFKKHKIVPMLLRHAELSKVLGTYVEGLRPFIDDDGRIRCGLNQNGTATGRFSSQKPNLQNWPRQSENENTTKIRSMFIASPGYTLVVGDYSQVELRLLAHFAGPHVKKSRLITTFVDELDPHQMTASGLFEVPLERVTKEQRQQGKTANFLLAFGGGPQRLVETGGYSAKLSEEIFAGFHRTYPEIDAWSQAVIRTAKQMKNPLVETIIGRRRRLPDIALPREVYNLNKRRSYAERQAVNAVIQGSAADINKMAMVRMFRRIQRRGKLGTWHLVLTVHDEIVLEVPEKDGPEAIACLREAMEQVKVDLRVPLVADIHSGPTWAAAK